MQCNIFWFRRDLRLVDNHGLYRALLSGLPVQGIFVFDRDILKALDDPRDARVHFIYEEVLALKGEMQKLGSDLKIFYLPMHSGPETSWQIILNQIPAKAVYVNRDYEPSAIQRDQRSRHYLHQRGIDYFDFKDHVVFEREEVCKDNGTPYTVFTAYKRKWMEKFTNTFGNCSESESVYPSEQYLYNLRQCAPAPIIRLSELGFEKSSVEFPPRVVPRKIITQYSAHRDFPYLPGTSRLGVHFRFGTISIRRKALAAYRLDRTYLSELIWRDFYSMILQAFPKVVNQSFVEWYDNIGWKNDNSDFEKWCKGETGFPLVDAGIRQLNATGYMHNRVRMVVASFLVKHLLVDWRWGEAYFAKKLLDYDLASNNGGWQWCAGCGTDAAPYYRIFNPLEQQRRFDPTCQYIKQFVPEFGTKNYPPPMVDHRFARERYMALIRQVKRDRSMQP